MSMYSQKNVKASFCIISQLEKHFRLKATTKLLTRTNTTTCVSANSKQKAPRIEMNRNKRRLKLAALSSVTVTGFLCSNYTRKWREEHINDLPIVQNCGFYVQNGSNDNYNKKERKMYNNNSNGKQNTGVRRDLRAIETVIARTGLMGKQRTVRDELDRIRMWHHEHGYKGGIVLRELSVPLFSENEFGDDDVGEYTPLEGGDDVEPIILPEQMKQRECYYLYYEIKPNGHALQQIFCRGTTITADVHTCLQFNFVFDDELGISLHRGFRDHADRLIKDVEPLLGPPRIRNTVEVNGHSLGGAVAFIVAMKLMKRGYNVSKVTAIAGARFCDKKDLKRVNDELLPRDALRIEDDLDGVPFLPPWASAAGDKLWLVNHKRNTPSKHSVEDLDKKTEPSSQYTTKYISRDQFSEEDDKLSWVDDCWMNIRLPEILWNINRTHRIKSHRSKIKDLIDSINNTQALDEAVGTSSLDNELSVE